MTKSMTAPVSDVPNGFILMDCGCIIDVTRYCGHFPERCGGLGHTTPSSPPSVDPKQVAGIAETMVPKFWRELAWSHRINMKQHEWDEDLFYVKQSEAETRCAERDRKIAELEADKVHLQKQAKRALSTKENKIDD